MKSSSSNAMDLIIYFYLEETLIDVNIFNKLIENINNNLTSLDSFGNTEPVKYQYPKDRDNLFQLYLEKFDFFLKGDRDSMVYIAFIPSHAISIWTIKLMNFDIKNKEVLIKFIQHIIDLIPIIYGFISSKEEFEHKHKLSIQLKSGGRATKFVGINKWDFLDFFSGVYSINVWSSQAFNLKEIIKRTKKSVNIIEYKNHLIAEVNDLFLDSTSYADTIQQKVANLIDSKVFFLKSENQSEFRHNERFKDYLHKLESR